VDLHYLLDRITAYYPEANVELVAKAFHFSQRAHKGQFRESGSLYFEHPYEVALILADLELDVETIAAGLLHDVLEDTEVTREEMEKEFGPTVLMLVEGHGSYPGGDGKGVWPHRFNAGGRGYQTGKAPVP